MVLILAAPSFPELESKGWGRGEDDDLLTFPLLAEALIIFLTPG